MFRIQNLSRRFYIDDANQIESAFFGGKKRKTERETKVSRLNRRTRQSDRETEMKTNAKIKWAKRTRLLLQLQ